jgi:hypothetical protein
MKSNRGMFHDRGSRFTSSNTHISQILPTRSATAARRSRGRTGTFHHFGPWSVSAFERIAPSLEVVGATSRKVGSRFRDDFVRYKVGDVDREELRNRLEEPFLGPSFLLSGARFISTVQTQLTFFGTFTLRRLCSRHGLATCWISQSPCDRHGRPSTPSQLMIANLAVASADTSRNESLKRGLKLL